MENGVTINLEPVTDKVTNVQIIAVIAKVSTL